MGYYGLLAFQAAFQREVCKQETINQNHASVLTRRRSKEGTQARAGSPESCDLAVRGLPGPSSAPDNGPKPINLSQKVIVSHTLRVEV